MKWHKKPRIALVYDRLVTAFGGAEVVMRALTELYPTAPLYTSVYNNQGKAHFSPKTTLRASFLQRFSSVAKSKLLSAPFSPFAIESLDLSEFDIVISVSSSFAKGVLTKPNQMHLCYLLTPTRYLYSHQNEYEQHSALNTIFTRPLVNLCKHYMSIWDQAAAMRPDYIVPISQLVSNRVKKFYLRQPLQPLYPPMALTLSTEEQKKLPNIKLPYFLSVSRLVGYKRVDLSIRACIKLKKNLIVAGEGEEWQFLCEISPTQTVMRKKGENLNQLIQRAQKNAASIIFTGAVTQNELHVLMKSMRALIMPAQEDFGITALEASFFGKPCVIAATSGVCELFQDKKHAIFISKPTVSVVAQAITACEGQSFDATSIQLVAQQHTMELFKKHFHTIVLEQWTKHRNEQKTHKVIH